MRLAPLVLVAALAAPARADDHDRQPIMAVDAASDTLLLAVFTPMSHDVSGWIFGIGLASQLLVPPIIHANANDWSRAGLDFGARIALPPLGMVVASVVCDDHSSKFLACLGPVFVGGIIGMFSAQIVDWLVISRPTDGVATRILSLGGRF